MWVNRDPTAPESSDIFQGRYHRPRISYTTGLALSGYVGSEYKNLLSASEPPSQGAYHFLAIVSNLNTFKMYIDGVLNVSSPFQTIDAGASYFGFGDAWTSNQFWKGYIDDARIYNRALSEAEIKAIYNATK